MVNVPLSVPTGVASTLPHGHLSNPGLVVAGERVYGEVGGMVVALDEATGRVAWHAVPDPSVGGIVSLAASPEHLFVSGSKGTMALRLSDGEVEAVMPGGGGLVLSRGLLFSQQPPTA